MGRSFNKAVLAATASTLVLAGTAQAQEGAEPEASPRRVLDVIEVTAERRQASQQDVPVTLTALDTERLREGDYRDAAELSQQVAGLQIKSSFSASNPTIFLRGVGINDFNPANSGAVGVTVDDVFYNSTIGQMFQLYDLERVEVLKGPQGTLYGRNTTGGVLNVATRAPGDAFGGYVTGTYGRFDQFDLEGAMDIPLGEQLALRISGVSNTRDGTRDVTLPDGSTVDRNDTDFQAARIQLLYEPSATLSVLGKVEVGRSRSSARSYESQGLINYTTGEWGLTEFDRVCGPSGSMCGDAFGYFDDADPYSGAENMARTPEDIDTVSASLRIDWDLGSFALTSVTGYLEAEREILLEVDASPNRLTEEYINDSTEQFSQEIRIASQWDGPLSVIAGAFYLSDTLEGRDNFELLAGASPTPGQPYFDLVNFIARVDREYTQELETFAVFAQTDYALTPRLTATLGARFTWEERELTHRSYAGPVDAVQLSEPAPLYYPLLDTSTYPTNTVSDEEPTYRLALSYQATDDVMVYGSLSRGFKSGGFNTGASSDPVEASIVEPEELTAWEVGIKSEWFDRMLRANAAAFFYDYSNLQVYGLAPGGVPTQTLFNAEEAEISGVELELLALPANGLEIGLSATYLDASYTDFVTPIGQTFTGNDMVAAPEWSLVPHIRYETLPFAGGYRLTLGATATYTGDQYFDNANTERLGQEAYWLVNARAALTAPGDQWELAAFIRNAFDETYTVDAFDVSDFGFDELVYGDPQTYGVSLTYRFGAEAY